MNSWFCSSDYKELAQHLTDFMDVADAHGTNGYFSAASTQSQQTAQSLELLLFSGSVMSNVCNTMNCSIPGFPLFHHLLERFDLEINPNVNTSRAVLKPTSPSEPMILHMYIMYDFVDF